MAHTIEPATSGRAKCRGCGEKIEKGALRLGERFPNPWGEGDATVWLHLECAAYKRPEPLIEALATTEQEVEGRDELERIAAFGAAHRRLPRLNGVERAPTGRARCRSCRETIEKDVWRIPLEFHEDGRFQASGFVHVRCAKEYFETSDVLDRLRHFGEGLSEGDVGELTGELAQG